MRKTIVGPILNDLVQLEWDGPHSVLATAFYSPRALYSVPIASRTLQVLCRLDRNDPREWANGYIAPDALLDRLRALEKSGTKIDLRTHEAAHAKVYRGKRGVLIGSANLTLQGFGGAWEMVEVSTAVEDIRRIDGALRSYARTLDPLSLAELERYVAEHGRFVRDFVRKRRSGERDQIPAPRIRPPRLGEYGDFLKWLARRTEPAASEIHQRAHGKGNLQGHINRNFFGLRQFFLAYPGYLSRFRHETPDSYKLSKDLETERELKEFVEKHAADEASFSLDTWKTYLPLECGGRAAKHGGTIGNLNRMLPLVARYLIGKSRR